MPPASVVCDFLSRRQTWHPKFFPETIIYKSFGQNHVQSMVHLRFAKRDELNMFRKSRGLWSSSGGREPRKIRGSDDWGIQLHLVPLRSGAQPRRPGPEIFRHAVGRDRANVLSFGLPEALFVFVFFFGGGLGMSNDQLAHGLPLK